MKFILTFSWEPDRQRRDEGIARFLKTGGMPPKGATLLGRWTRLDLSGGFVLLESDDPKALAEFGLRCNVLKFSNATYTLPLGATVGTEN